MLKTQNSYNIPRRYFENGLTYNGLGSKGLCFRFLEDNTLFDMGSSAVFGTHTYFCLESLILHLLNIHVIVLIPL